MLLTIAYCVLFTLAISTIIWFIYYPLFDQTYKILGYYIITTLAVESLNVYLWQSGQNNLFLIHFYTLAEFILVSFFLKSIIKSPPFLIKHFSLIISISSVFIICNSIFIQGFNSLNSYAETFENSVLILLILFFFYDLFGKENATNNQSKSLTIINSGLFIYLSGSLTIFLFGDFLVKISQKDQVGLWNFNALLNLGLKIMILLGLMLKIRSKKTMVN